MLPIRPATAPWATEANSSSANATLPVIRARASPDLTNSSSAAASRIARVATPARLDAGQIELWLNQHEFVRSGEIGDVPAQQTGPRQRAR